LSATVDRQHTASDSHMPAVLNAAGVKAACVGNHDFDFGMENLAMVMADCEFPWLCANAFHKDSGKPLCNAKQYTVIEHCGRRIGVVGLIEEEWLCAMSCIDPTTLEYRDLCEVGREIALTLKSAGAELIIALTHCREPNDLKLLEAVPEIDLVLGGHDHHYVVKRAEDGRRWMIKSGTDFRTMSKLVVDFSGEIPQMDVLDKLEVTKETAEDPAMLAFVQTNMKELQAAASKVLGTVAIPLEARFCEIRTSETNVGNWVADVMRDGCVADVAICTAGTLRADDIFPAGEFTLGDLQRLLPFLDELCVVALSGTALRKVLENGVSQWPKLEGRFPQVSGLRFSFDPSLEPGSRVVSVEMEDGTELDPVKEYHVASMEFITKGKDGYDAFLEGRVVKDGELLPMLPSLMRNHLQLMRVADASEPLINSWRRESIALALQSGNVTKHAEKSSGDIDERRPSCGPNSILPEQVKIAPCVDGRICRIDAKNDNQAHYEVDALLAVVDL